MRAKRERRKVRCDRHLMSDDDHDLTWKIGEDCFVYGLLETNEIQLLKIRSIGSGWAVEIIEKCYTRLTPLSNAPAKGSVTGT